VLHDFPEQVAQLDEDFFRREPPPPMPKLEACFLILVDPQEGQTTAFSPPRRVSASKRQEHSSQTNS
jgi:hypothetical protein